MCDLASARFLNYALPRKSMHTTAVSLWHARLPWLELSDHLDFQFQRYTRLLPNRLLCQFN